MPQAPVAFRLYPASKRSLYVHVNIWPDHASMSKHFGKQGMRTAEVDNKVLGNSQTMQRYKRDKNGKLRLSPCMGEINLCKEHLTYEVIYHEVLHAALAWARRVGGILAPIANPDEAHVSDAEERLCYACSNMIAQLAAVLHGRGYWETICK